ncbi:hypothetical protein QVA60_01635 [Staphylococcus chromogenes]|uniref:hypothetical protein n=1 Tax=Staphylococcus chromogenes TaxID=46126 RepID=UPI002900070A|nr:hypothetical protein [Staphylococcus chromogenes]MDU0429187.1 hypothetical protein [Staphylococcus chromogenes]
MKGIFKVVIILFSLLVIGLIVYPITAYNHTQEYKGTITEKYNKRTYKQDEFYIVLDDKTVVENSDLLFKGKFDSADIQAKLKVGDKVTIKTVGYRIHILNQYPTLYEYEEDE